MKDPHFPHSHLTWSMNVHPGESWADQAQAVQDYALPLKQRFAPHTPFGLGLRLSARSARELCARPDELNHLRDKLDQQGLYVFTVNAFPYGPFHDKTVKAAVYRPDWRDEERERYTQDVITILAKLLLPGVPGSISTVPGGFKPDLHPNDACIMAERMCRCAQTMSALWQNEQIDICLALEPEPGCLLENTNDVLNFFGTHIPKVPELRRHLGVCLDTCHSALAYEHPADAINRIRTAGIALPKVQLSAALEVPNTSEGRTSLQDFNEAVYLHQVRDELGNSWNDLPEALEDSSSAQFLRCHFHVPLFWEGRAPLSSTCRLLDTRLREALYRHAIPHLEIETYTFQVLPGFLGTKDLLDSLTKEYRWWLN